MKFIVTGGAGFIGSHLTDSLLKLGHKVLVLDDFSTGSYGNLSSAMQTDRFKLLECDIKNPEIYVDYIEEGDTILHLAATVGVEKVCINPMETYDTNLTATRYLLDIAVRKKCKFFFASTSEVYGEASANGLKEDVDLPLNHQFPGRSTYTLAKLMSEHLCLCFAQQFNLPVTISRFFNTIGTRQCSSFGMVVPRFIEQALNNKTISVYGDGLQTRSFIDVRDTTAAILELIGNQDAQGQIFNIGNLEPVTIIDLAKFIKRECNSTSSIIFKDFPPERSNGQDILFRQPNIDKIRSMTNWLPEISWQDSVANLINEAKISVNPTSEGYISRIA